MNRGPSVLDIPRVRDSWCWTKRRAVSEDENEAERVAFFRKSLLNLERLAIARLPFAILFTT